MPPNTRLVNNLFSIFDPETSLYLRLNWLSLLLAKILFLSVSMKNEFMIGYNRFNKTTSSIFTSLFNEFSLPLGGKVTPFSISLFVWIFIFCCSINFIGLIPYVFTPSSRISLTLGIAIRVWILMEMGFIVKALKRFLSHLVPRGTPNLLIPLMVVIELVRNFIRPITLSVRLAANIVAGHLLIRLINGGTINIFLIPVIISSGVILIFLEVSVAFIQGYVFSTLRVIYFSELNAATK